jgi:ATP-dependent protease HslVU (ClpYQ) ATPase subunit
MEQISYEACERGGEMIKINEEYVKEKIKKIFSQVDLYKYVL